MVSVYPSKYFNLENLPSGWNDEDFRFAVEVLETVDRRILFELLKKFGIRFDEKIEKYLEDEDLISALLDDSSKDDLLIKLREIVGEKPHSLRTWTWGRNSERSL